MATPVLDVQNLSVRFETHRGTVQAVSDLSFTLAPGETLGIVGESGCGKSVTSLAIMGLVPTPPGVVTADALLFEGRDLLKLSRDERRRVRGGRIAMIFQDPMTSLNPLVTVGRQLAEVLEVHENVRGRAARARCAKGLGDVGIPNPEARLDAYPHELSGGMRQRVMIAMGLLCRPRVLIADEPTTALDVTIQAQILELMRRLQKEHGTAIVLITHDLGVVAGTADRVQVMYAGRVVERGGARELFARPLHPYTRGLLGSVPKIDGDPNERLASIEGQPPDLALLPRGCAFEPRCALRTARCVDERPQLTVLAPTRSSACHESARLLAGGAS
jgi:oligopeptide transport system ATP-binding protein